MNPTLLVAGLVTALALAPIQGRGGATSKGGDTKPATATTSEKKKDDSDLAKLYFSIADWDGDGWIRFSEAEHSLGLDRAGFAVFDTDHDGRITPDEFTTRYLAVIQRGGAFTPPIPKVEKKKEPKRTPEELLSEFDVDKTGALELGEIATALTRYDARGIEASVILTTLDTDKSHALEAPELDAFMSVLHPEPTTQATHAKTLADLFDRVEPRTKVAGATPSPPRIVGPVSLFRRLDLDQSGAIGLADLVELQRPLQSSVRVNAVLATLDANGDGEIDAEEFRAAMDTGAPVQR